MKDFDYATLIRVIEIGINPKDNHELYVCDNRRARNNFLRHHERKETDYIFTIEDVWKYNHLVGLHYKSYKLIH